MSRLPVNSVVVVFTLNRSFYPTISAVNPVPVLILHPREIQTMWSQTETDNNGGGYWIFSRVDIGYFCAGCHPQRFRHNHRSAGSASWILEHSLGLTSTAVVDIGFALRATYNGRALYLNGHHNGNAAVASTFYLTGSSPTMVLLLCVVRRSAKLTLRSVSSSSKLSIIVPGLYLVY